MREVRRKMHQNHRLITCCVVAELQNALFGARGTRSEYHPADCVFLNISYYDLACEWSTKTDYFLLPLQTPLLTPRTPQSPDPSTSPRWAAQGHRYEARPERRLLLVVSSGAVPALFVYSVGMARPIRTNHCAFVEGQGSRRQQSCPASSHHRPASQDRYGRLAGLPAQAPARP